MANQINAYYLIPDCIFRTQKSWFGTNSLRTLQVYFKGALGALVVYDVSRPETFDSAVKVSGSLHDGLWLMFLMIPLDTKRDAMHGVEDANRFDRSCYQR